LFSHNTYITNNRQTRDGRNIVAEAWPLVQSAKITLLDLVITHSIVPQRSSLVPLAAYSVHSVKISGFLMWI